MKHIHTFEGFLNEWSIVPGLGGKKHRGGDKFTVIGELILRVQRGTSKESVELPIGYEIAFEEEAPNGNVWFTFVNPKTGKEDRGHTQSGSLKNMLEAGYIR